MESNEEIQEFSIGKLFEDTSSYMIPIYQRNYAWTKSEVEQLIIDIHDYSLKNPNINYYIGSLVVFEKNINGKKIFETIDGQQRLTTLSILLSVLKNEYKQIELKFNHLLNYESRDISTNTLEHIYNGQINFENLNPTMENAYKTIKVHFNKSKENINLKSFKDYLLNKVHILRVKVPKDTDLNHYFEIMNNRGEQLEKHEVLKARMLEKLSCDNEKKSFNDIWEACSDMYRYVQYGFPTHLRDKIFGNDWNEFICGDFDEFVSLNDKEKDFYKLSYSIDEIISGSFSENLDIKGLKSDSDTPDRFTSPINFSNFLLHVLKVSYDNKTTLDDKTLLETFNDFDEVFVRNFGFNLLKIRFLFDNYVIKREYTSNVDRWSLQQAYKYTYNKGSRVQDNIQYKNRFDTDDKNKQVLMLLSMFHVSNPSQIYKYWLSGVLNYIYRQYNERKLDIEEYIKYLEKLAKQFFFNRYIANEPQEFDNIIFNDLEINNDIIISKLDQGTSVEHFVFNYLDYLLWNSKDKNNFDYFSFSFSNSVEHFYPQNPIEGHKSIEDIDNFGNLCLISVSKNAKLNNHPPSAKLSYYPNNQYDSLKQHIMMQDASNWDEKMINEHRQKMFKVLGIDDESI